MRWRVWAGGIILAGLALLLLPAAQGQATFEFGTPQSTDVSPGVLYFKPDVVDRVESEGIDRVCAELPEQTAPLFAISEEPPDSREPQRVYDYGSSAPAFDCTQVFQYQVEDPFTLSRGATVSVWANCHRPTPVYANPTANGGEVQYAFTLTHNGEQIDRYSGRGPVDIPAGVCTDAILQGLLFHGVLDPGSVAFEAGDTLGIGVALFHETSPGNTSYVKVDGFHGPSALYGVGLPGTVRAGPTARLGVEPPDAPLQAGPGNATTTTVTVRNDGASDRSLDMTIEGPEDWLLHPEGRFVDVPGGSTARLNLTAAAPSDALDGEKATHVVTLSSDGGEIAFETTTRAIPGTGSPTDLLPSEETLEPEEATSKVNASQDDVGLAQQHAGGDDEAESTSAGGSIRQAVSELWVEMLATAIVATLAAFAKVFWA